jgi:hypothetical protein
MGDVWPGAAGEQRDDGRGAVAVVVGVESREMNDGRFDDVFYVMSYTQVVEGKLHKWKRQALPGRWRWSFAISG